MKTLFLLTALLTLASPAPRAQDWTAYANAENAVKAAASDVSRNVKPLEGEPQPQSDVKVTDDATWAKLLDRAVKRPTRVQTAHAGGADYKVYVVETETPLMGQDCPAGTSPQNVLYVSKTAKNMASDVIYPVRITAVCKGAYEVRDSFSLNADLSGTILALTIYDGSLGIAVHPLQDSPSAPSAAEASSLQEFMSRLVKLFLDVP